MVIFVFDWNCGGTYYPIGQNRLEVWGLWVMDERRVILIYASGQVISYVGRHFGDWGCS